MCIDSILVREDGDLIKSESYYRASGSDGGNLSGTRVGPSLIKQCISALEYYRSHLSHRADYASDPNSQLQLRNDIRIRTYERSAKASEPERMEKMQMMKINGVMMDFLMLSHGNILS